MKKSLLLIVRNISAKDKLTVTIQSDGGWSAITRKL